MDTPTEATMPRGVAMEKRQRRTFTEYAFDERRLWEWPTGRNRYQSDSANRVEHCSRGRTERGSPVRAVLGLAESAGNLEPAPPVQCRRRGWRRVEIHIDRLPPGMKVGAYRLHKSLPRTAKNLLAWDGGISTAGCRPSLLKCSGATYSIQSGSHGAGLCTQVCTVPLGL
jgi:hypothetical protein